MFERGSLKQATVQRIERIMSGIAALATPSGEGFIYAFQFALQYRHLVSNTGSAGGSPARLRKQSQLCSRFLRSAQQPSRLRSQLSFTSCSPTFQSFAASL